MPLVLSALLFGPCSARESTTCQGPGVTYVGRMSKTKSGRTCQNWNETSPQMHTDTMVGQHNYCRCIPSETIGQRCFLHEVSIIGFWAQLLQEPDRQPGGGCVVLHDHQVICVPFKGWKINIINIINITRPPATWDGRSVMCLSAKTTSLKIQQQQQQQQPQFQFKMMRCPQMSQVCEQWPFKSTDTSS